MLKTIESKLENRFDKEIKNRKFNFLEIAGFEVKPNLAIKAGMAIGYQMAIDDVGSWQPEGAICRKRP